MGYENAAQFDRAAKRSIKNTGKDRMGFLSVIYHSGQDTPLYLLALSAASKMRSALAKMRASSPTVMS